MEKQKESYYKKLKEKVLNIIDNSLDAINLIVVYMSKSFDDLCTSLKKSLESKEVEKQNNIPGSEKSA